MNREDRIDRMADLVLQRALRKAQETCPPAVVHRLFAEAQVEPPKPRNQYEIEVARFNQLVAERRASNVIQFPTRRREGALA